MSADLIARDAAADAALVREVFDALIDAHLDTLASIIARDLQATAAPGADAVIDALMDAPPSPEAAWRPVSVEEVIAAERAALERWRDRQLGR